MFKVRLRSWNDKGWWVDGLVCLQITQSPFSAFAKTRAVIITPGRCAEKGPDYKKGAWWMHNCLVYGRVKFISPCDGENNQKPVTLNCEQFPSRKNRPPLCTCRLNWARRTSWGWWDDPVLQTQDSKFEPWRSEAEHATSWSRRLPTILTFTRGWGRNIFCFFFKPPRPGTEPRTLAWKAAVRTTTLRHFLRELVVLLLCASFPLTLYIYGGTINKS